MLRPIVVLACLAGLAACETTVDSQGAPTGTPSSDPALLEFRKVLRTEPVQTPAQPEPSPAAPADQAEIDKAKAMRQSLDVTDEATVRAALDALDCTAPDPLRGNDDPALPLVTCDRTAPAKYVLEPAFLTGADVDSARAEQDPQSGRHVVSITFRDEGAKIWTDFTTQNVTRQVAILLDASVLSAPTIQEPILTGTTIIHGGDGGFTEDEAERFAARLGSS